MANPLDNLTHKLTVEEVRKGGKKSGEVRRLKKAMKEMLLDALESENSKGLTYGQLVTMGLIKGAIDGNARNYETIVTMLGEAPNLIQEEERETPSIEINVVDNSDLEKIMYDKRKE